MIVSKINLLLFTASVWLVAAYMLLHKAFAWKNLFDSAQLILAIAIGIGLGALKSYFIFHKITVENVARIMNLDANKVTLWQFHATRHKIIILVMILLGVTLRRLPFVLKEVLFPIYLGIGLAMVYVVVLYFVKIKKIVVR